MIWKWRLAVWLYFDSLVLLERGRKLLKYFKCTHLENFETKHISNPSRIIKSLNGKLISSLPLLQMLMLILYQLIAFGSVISFLICIALSPAAKLYVHSAWLQLRWYTHGWTETARTLLTSSYNWKQNIHFVGLAYVNSEYSSSFISAKNNFVRLLLWLFVVWRY